MNLNNIPTSEHEVEDRCPGCGDPCDIFTDLDEEDFCNNCRVKNINIILAMSENLTIGKDNDLPWNLPTDLKRFKEITQGNVIIMGRKCYESIGRPLPNRENVIITSDENLNIPGCLVFNDLQSVFSYFKNDKRGIFIIGGANVYEQTFSIANRLYLTLIKGSIDGDVKISGLNLGEWNFIDQSKTYTENGHSFKFMDFEK